MPEAHLARHVVDVAEGLDLSVLKRAHTERGSDAYHPATLLCLLIYGYATSTFSRRKIKRAIYDSLAFRYITCNRHPDHDTFTGAFHRVGTAGGWRFASRSHETQTPDPSGASYPCATQADGGTCIRHRQVGNGVPAIYVLEIGECPQRMDAGLPRVEFEAHDRIASTAGKQGGSIAFPWENKLFSASTPSAPP